MFSQSFALIVLRLLSSIHPAQPDFNSAEAVFRCVSRVETRLIPYLGAKFSEQNLTLVTLKSPELRHVYSEKFSRYGGHVFFDIDYVAVFEDKKGAKKDALVTIPFSTTTRINESYVFVKQGEAIRNTERAAYVIPGRPVIHGHPPRVEPSLAAVDKFKNDYLCEIDSVMQSEITAQYPRCIDPSENCVDIDH